MIRLIAVCLAMTWPAQALAGISLGVAPCLEPLKLIRLYQPLAAYLQAELGEPVLVRTRGSFAEFAQAIGDGRFELAIVPPHLARLVQRRNVMTPLAAFDLNMSLLVALREGQELDALRGRSRLVAAVPDPHSLVSVVGRRWLSRQLPGVEIELLSLRSHSNAALSVISGESDLAFVNNTVPAKLPARYRQRLRFHDSGESVPQRVVLCLRPKPEFCERAGAALRAFAATEAGAAFFRHRRLGGLIAPQPLERFDDLLGDLEARLYPGTP